MNFNIHANAIVSKVHSAHPIGSNTPAPYLLAMKLSLILMTVFSLNVTAGAIAQKIDIHAKNEPLKNVLQEMSRQSGYAFLYKDKGFTSARPVTIHLHSKDLFEALPLVLANQPFTYEANGKVISIIPKEIGILKKTGRQVSQQTIRGRVTDSLGNPLQGVTVQVKESGWQTITDRDGWYEIEGVYPTETLRFRLLSYEPFETVANRAEIDVTLRLLYSELEEIDVVSTGYQEIPKERATGSFVHIDNELLNRRVGTNLVDRLEGITSGLVFYRSSSTNEPTLNIRGRSTIFANDRPLVVIDNFPFDGDINSINPNDIQDISILKDAAAASIWGVRAGNGVIVITTKKGSIRSRPIIELNTNITIAPKPDFNYIPMMTSPDFIEVEKEYFSRGYYESLESNANKLALSPVIETLIASRDGTISESLALDELERLKRNDVRDDFAKYLYRNSINQQYALSVRGGGERSTFYISGGYDNNMRNERRNYYERLNLTAANSLYIFDKLQFHSNVNIFHTATTQNNGGINDLVSRNARKYYPYSNFIDGSGNSASVNYDHNNGYKQEMESAGFMNWDYYPLDELYNADNFTKVSGARINTALKYEFLEGLTADILYQYEKQFTRNRIIRGTDTYFTRDLINTYTQLSEGSLTYPVPVGAIFDRRNNDLTGNTVRGQLSYQKNFSQNHSLSAIIGSEAKQVKIQIDESRLYGFDSETGISQNVNYNQRYNTNPTSGRNIPYPKNFDILTDRFLSYYINGAYTLKNKYTFSLSSRIDKSNYFGVKSNQRSVPLWSAGMSWEISRERFYNVGWLPYLRMKATHGYSGNIDKSITAYVTASYEPDYLTGFQTAYVVSPPNPRLRWEKVNITNIGLDFRIRNSIISGSIEYFTKRGLDLIGESLLDPTMGINSFKGNLANMVGSGIDIDIATNNITTPSFSWSTNLLFSSAKDKVTKYHREQTSGYSYIQLGTGSLPQLAPSVGRPVYSLYSYRWAGLDPQTGDPIGYLNGEESTNYTAIQATNNPLDYVYNGPVNPTFFGGIRNTIQWREISFSFNITYKLGHYFRRSSIDYNALLNNGIGHSDYALRWQKQGDELTTSVPSMPTSTPSIFRETYFYLNSEILVERADHIRLQDISLSYNIGQSKLRGTLFRSFDIYMYANNLGVLWRKNKHGIDPDAIPNSSAVYLPAPRSISIGLRTKF
ncbi:SusC/RagA family TonB-linked outer membrane protein [Parapedobacter sp. 10938]|uniref:SusC/RagA family TonB-linked outer membrane protein n=1 Tax=Parapedobacter flavus TaxID=3110225 RepID=UPI002DB65B93|nr:SusC/RagA family TonB-linked outer membrane protein [Parapedobacter sp. 10938]MEC3880214.1 SusC/RagA family TonB-linked outer membrane protein [Parapedobacter sp. 10938]